MELAQSSRYRKQARTNLPIVTHSYSTRMRLALFPADITENVAMHFLVAEPMTQKIGITLSL